MNAHEIEALEYPSVHRNRALELMRQREAFTAALAGVPAVGGTPQAFRRALVVVFAAIPFALLSAGASMAGLVSDRSANFFSLLVVVVALIAFIVIARIDQIRYRRARLEAALKETARQLDDLRNDYTTPEGEYGPADLATVDALTADVRETSNKFVIGVAIIGVIGIGVFLVWAAIDPTVM